MFTPTFQIRDLASPKVKAILAALTPAQRRAMLGRLGKELEKQLKAHFAAREQEPNKTGWPSQHFWAREVRAKTSLRDYTEDRATVGIDSAPFRFKITGGTIRPGPGRRALAIPMQAQVAGVLPRSGTIQGLFLLKAGGKAYLASRVGAHFQFVRLYWRLVASVHQAPDPRALPPIADLQKAIEAKANEELQRITAQTA